MVVRVVPNFLVIGTILFLGISLGILSGILPKKINLIVEVAIVIGVTIYLFVSYSIGEAMLLISLGAASYAEFAQLFERGKRIKRQEIMGFLATVEYVEIKQKREMKRLLMDYTITLFVSFGAISFLLFGPETYAVIKLFIGFMLISIVVQSIIRLGNFGTTSIYFIPKDERIVIVSRFQSRDYPLHDVKDVTVETSVDLLKLHPMFSFLSSNLDFTQSFQKVLKLTFPGEILYLTPIEVEKWNHQLRAFLPTANLQEEKKVLPLWHSSNLKRLFWKGYFAITIKGISGYTGLLLLLIWLDVPIVAMIITIVGWWLLNLYVSDKVLRAGSDAIPVLDGGLYERAKKIFAKAGIPNAKLYISESPIYNGLATGMNIGSGTVILTSATLQLPSDSVDAILAHEAVHVKKRDVLTIQLTRLLYIGMLATVVYFLFDELKWLAENHGVLLFVIVYGIMFVFPLLLSFVSQWTEVRADYLGAGLLPNGRRQLAQGLIDLTINQEKDVDKSMEYQFSNQQMPTAKKGGVERDTWGWRFLEFQFLPHPPMYWRIHSLNSYNDWTTIRKDWLKDRWKESIPDRFRKRV